MDLFTAYVLVQAEQASEGHNKERIGGKPRFSHEDPIEHFSFHPVMFMA